MKRVRRSFVSATVVLAALTCIALASQDRSARTFNVDVDLVLIPATVTDSRGQYVTGLDASHFQITEDKVQQEISYFSTEDAAMSLGIVLDTSGSMDPILNTARRNGGACLDVGLEDDEYFVMMFSDKLTVDTGFTTDIRQLQSQLLTMRAKGRTALYDAVYAGLVKVRDGIHPRKALVIVSDGYENHSRYSARNLREAVQESDGQVYTIGNEGDGALRQLSEISGGRSLSPRSRTFALANICSQIVRELKSQYLLGYKSTNTAKDGKWRNVRLKLDPPANMKLSVRAKTGYYPPNTTF